MATLPIWAAGCYAGVVGALLGATALTGKGSSSEAVVANLRLEPSPGGARAADLPKVEISFDLIQADSYRVEFARDEPGQRSPPVFQEVRVGEISSGGNPRRVAWNAKDYGLAGLTRVRLRVSPGAGGKPAEGEFEIGNDSPTVSEVEVEIPGQAASGNILIS